MAGKRCEYPIPSYLSLSCSGWIFLFESVVNSTHPSAKSNIYVSSANPLPFSILSSVHENFLCTVSPGILPDLSLPWTSIRKRRVILRNKTAMNIQIMRSVQRCRKAWESRMLQRFVYPLGLLWARPNCPQTSCPPSPLLAPSVKHPIYRALAVSEDAGNHPDLFPFPFSIPKSGFYSQFLFLSFQSFFY